MAFDDCQPIVAETSETGTIIISAHVYFRWNTYVSHDHPPHVDILRSFFISGIWRLSVLLSLKGTG